MTLKSGCNILYFYPNTSEFQFFISVLKSISYLSLVFSNNHFIGHQVCLIMIFNFTILMLKMLGILRLLSTWSSLNSGFPSVGFLRTICLKGCTTCLTLNIFLHSHYPSIYFLYQDVHFTILSIFTSCCHSIVEL